ncbi:hypothetical protein GCM10007423_27570 [Dyadobacter endophyticus]|uniref:Uncharacterized protein n=1 Tax=Dyadobacter endophyticus TaxID=1749036 RepID=A0ABQ1YTB8_9BACT|nr:hypothetical protein [Dyadobacter endophyticus]GGH35725.1 hypothetical protein GCM10007423_27570 [Dyadobacter endophyticus]
MKPERATWKANRIVTKPTDNALRVCEGVLDGVSEMRKSSAPIEVSIPNNKA